jgi:O-antigen/teichoic acid export membrane protein
METAPPISQRAAAPPPPGHDLTGQSRLVANVLFTWAGQMIFFAAGFVMPRLIDHRLGQAVLGVWDFSWSLVTYFRFVDMGVASSVNRYVGYYWGKQDIEGINRVVSSATAALVIAGAVILMGTIVAVATLPHWLGHSLREYTVVTQESVLCLGAMFGIQTSLGAYNGVLTGCHRWELQTMRNSFWYVMIVVGMFIALKLGAGLVTLAIINAAGQILAHLTLVALAYRACPGLRLRRSYIQWNTIKELYIYSGKTLIPTVSDLLLNQTTSFLLITGLGPAALAIFTRPRSLLRQMDSLERKMAMILVPMTSSMVARGKTREIEKLVIKSVRYSIYLVLPLVLVLVIFGGEVMRTWMGAKYANAALPAILAVGFLGTCIQTPIFSMLSGLNAHGYGGLGQLFASVVSAAGVFVALKFFHAGLVVAAIAVTVPLLFVNLFYLPLLLCRRLGRKLAVFYREVAVGPLLYVLPFAACLCVGRILYSSHPVLAGAVSLAGAIVLMILYFKNVLPDRLKSSIRGRWGKFVRFTGVRCGGGR